jgi:large subunit ribosomal protein L21
MLDSKVAEMYAIIEDGGRQFKVEEGQQIDVDYREVSSGQELRFDRVLAYRDEDGLQVGQPTLDSATVTAEVLGVAQGPKLAIQKFRRRKNYRRKTGHRQLYTRVKISKIEMAGGAPADTRNLTPET